MGKMYRYPHDYCPYCYHKIETYSFYCPKCVAQHPETAVTQPDKNIPLDYRGIPLCSNCGSVMRICCSNDACRKQHHSAGTHCCGSHCRLLKLRKEHLSA